MVLRKMNRLITPKNEQEAAILKRAGYEEVQVKRTARKPPGKPHTGDEDKP